jgi:hypothetical protein
VVSIPPLLNGVKPRRKEGIGCAGHLRMSISLWALLPSILHDRTMFSAGHKTHTEPNRDAEVVWEVFTLAFLGPEPSRDGPKKGV